MKRPKPRPTAEVLLALAVLSLASACSVASGDSATPPNAPVLTLNADPRLNRIASRYEASILDLVERVAQDRRIRRDAVEAVLGAEFDAKPSANGRPQEWSLHGSLSERDRFRIELYPDEDGLELAIANPADDGKKCYLDSMRVRSLLVDRLGYKATELGTGKRPYTLFTQNPPPASSPISVSVFERELSAEKGGARNCIYALKLAARGG